MTGGPVRAFEITGPAAPAALEWLHVHAAVCAVHETDRALTVFVDGPPVRVPFAGVTVREVAIDERPVTGLERDRVIAVADDLIVRPPWVPAPAGFAGVELVVPRGAAFGSGEHASTQAALLVLHALWDAPRSVADVGTGSGILALYAQSRGCPAVQACDVDPAAVAAAAALLPAARVVRGGPERLAAADCVVANLSGAELQRALAAILGLWTGAGPLVLGGMRDAEVDGVAARVPGAPARVERRGAFRALGYPGAGAR